MNLVLMGYRCSGKTSVGKILARRLGMRFCDTDAFIEKQAGKDIKTLVAQSGWACFRERERRAVEVISRLDRTVIATGGGVALDEGNVRNLKKNGWIVWLKAEPQVLEKRMGKEKEAGRHRPSLTGGDSVKEIRKVLEKRAPFYDDAAHLVVDTTALSSDAVAERIMNAFQMVGGR